MPSYYMDIKPVPDMDPAISGYFFLKGAPGRKSDQDSRLELTISASKLMWYN